MLNPVYRIKGFSNGGAYLEFGDELYPNAEKVLSLRNN